VKKYQGYRYGKQAGISFLIEKIAKGLTIEYAHWMRGEEKKQTLFSHYSPWDKKPN